MSKLEQMLADFKSKDTMTGKVPIIVTSIIMLSCIIMFIVLISLIIVASVRSFKYLKENKEKFIRDKSTLSSQEKTDELMKEFNKVMENSVDLKGPISSAYGGNIGYFSIGLAISSFGAYICLIFLIKLVRKAADWSAINIVFHVIIGSLVSLGSVFTIWGLLQFLFKQEAYSMLYKINGHIDMTVNWWLVMFNMGMLLLLMSFFAFMFLIGFRVVLAGKSE